MRVLVLIVAAVLAGGGRAETARDPKLRVVVFGGHPDDPESGAGGLMALLARDGHEVISAYGTCYRGDRKIGGEPENTLRRREAVAGCKVLGVTPKFFDYAHENFVADADTLKTVSSWLDEVKPDVVVTHWPLDTHPNHHVVSSLVWQCYKPAGGWNLYWFEVLTGRQTLGFRPELYLDIDPVRAVKKEALDCHKESLRVVMSQRPDELWRLHEEMHRLRGAEAAVTHAEAYALVEAKPGCRVLPVPFLRRRNP